MICEDCGSELINLFKSDPVFSQWACPNQSQHKNESINCQVLNTVLIAKPNQDTSMHCLVCGTNDKPMHMFPITDKTLVVGWVYSCEECKSKMTSQVIHYTIITQDIQEF